jgi:subtilisin family serine protease
MKLSSSVGFLGSTVALLLSGNALPGAVPAQLQQAMQEGQHDVIVIMRDQLPNLPPQRRAMSGRASAIAMAHDAVLSQMPQLRLRKLHSFSTINAFATSLSDAEAKLLAARPDVQAVVNDRVIQPLPRRESRAEQVPAAAATSATSTGTSASDGGLCNTLEPEALQLTHAAYADTSIPQAQQVRDGHGQFVTGTGVKVAFLADGLDPTVQGFVRPDGTSVFIDYQDFSGDPAGTPTDGGEAFGDASSIAAQDMPNGKPLIFDISTYVNAAHPLPSPCSIRIRGMAPGAALVGLKVFSQINPTTTSNFVQAIEYAVIHDDVDVINESFGGNPYPDNSNDPISLADDAAVRAGVTVVVSSGDSGPTGTLGSPSTDSNVIESGATTQFRVYAQTGDGIQPLLKSPGFIDNNLSAFSSGGFSQLNARTVDAVAPGDSGWALCSTSQTLYTDCGSDAADAPAAIQVFGGTSESSPLTAGEAALIIQAYRSTHGGTDPTPATVKAIIKSTATDLSAPSSEQGAGLINALAAVNLALSIDDQSGKPKPRGDGLLLAPGAASAIGEPNDRIVRTFTVSNEGSSAQHLTANLETLGAPFAGATLNLTLDPTVDPHFINVAGNTRVYTTTTFKVPANADHLDAAVAFLSPLSIAATNPPLVFLSLIDPSGREAAESNPQGLGSGYGHVDIVKPQAGTWTAVVWTRKTGVAGSYSGPIEFTWGAERYVKFGSVSPAQLDLGPGAHETLTAQFAMPAAPGDLAAAIRFAGAAAGSGPFAEIPVTLRTLIPTGPSGGNFTGTLTGGNGRAGAGPTQTYVFDVPKGVNNMSLTLEIADNGYLLEGLLVDPNGMQLSVMPNQDPANGAAQFALQVSHYDPQPGRWKFVLVQNYTSSGNQTSLPFTARIGFNTASITATGLPDGAGVQLSASGKPVTVAVNVTNTGPVTKLYFADARLDTLSVAELPPQTCSSSTTLPGACGQWFVPTQVSTATFVAKSNVPITMDAFNDEGTGVGATGNPDIFAKRIAPDTVAASLSEPEVPYSAWIASPSLIGPYGPAGAFTAPVTTSAYVLMHGFDLAVSADSGDVWSDLVLNTQTFNPLQLAPGDSGTIHVTITPDPGKVGKTVAGFIYIDTFDFNVFTGDEVVRIPYSYTVVP